MIDFIQRVGGHLTTTKAQSPVYSKSYDIAVIGMGVAGAISAITGAKKNLKILGIERLSASGGTMTMSGICGYYFGGAGGIFEEVDKSLREKSGLAVEPSFDHPDLRKYNLDCEIEKCGAAVMYESVVVGLYRDGRKITGIRVFDGKEETDIAVKMLIDATGDGDICDMAGCSMDFGRESDGSVVPFTISKSTLVDGKIRKTNHDSGIIDQRNAEKFSRAILEAQSYFINKKEDEKILRLHSLPGIREGRLLNGEKKITIDDFLNGIYDKEPVIYAYADLDKHGTDTAFDAEMFRRWHVISNLGALNITVPVPMGALIAKEYDNLLVAGRCLSVDHEMLTCIRMNRDMQKLGEVAAVVASIAIEDGVPLKEVKYERVEPLLRATGCLSEANNIGFKYDGGADKSYRRKAEWLTDQKEINEQLSTLKPGLAIWSCRILGDKIKPLLKSNLESDNENLRKHSALALAVMDDNSGAAVLREMVAKRDRTSLEDMRKHNKTRITMAACALGVLRDQESIDTLMEFISDKEEYKFYPVVQDYVRDYYNALSNAVSALFSIIDAHPARRKEVEEFLEKEFSSLEYVRKITDLNEYSSQYIMAADIYKNICIWKNKNK